MRSKKLHSLLFVVFMAIVSMGLSACLGGAGSAANGGAGGIGENGSTSAAQATVTLALLSSQSPTAGRVASVTYGTSIWVMATIKNAAGAAIPNTVVSFATDSPLVVFTPTSASALTDSEGRAWMRLDAASLSAAGATTLTASASVTSTSNGTNTSTSYTSAPLGVAVNATSVTLGTMTLSPASISAYGTSSISVPVLINGAPASVPIQVVFTSSCAATDKAVLSSPVMATGGFATTTYKDANCASGSDVITASVGDASVATTITVASSAASLTLSLLSSASPTATLVNTVNYGSPVWALASLKNAAGAAIPNTVVSFATDSPMVVFTPVSASALTDSDGRAWVRLDAASLSTAGATTLTASANVVSSNGSNTSTATSYTTAPLGVAVNASNITLGAMTLSPASISAYGSSTISVPVLLNGAPIGVPVSVVFSSPCAASGKAELSSPVTTVGGIATATYKDTNCATGSDVIMASMGTATQSATIVVPPPSANNLQFVSALPTVIGIQGTGSLLQQNASVTFKVVDASNNGRQGVPVSFGLLQSPRSGGATLANYSAISGADGNVTATVMAGTVPMPVTVLAQMAMPGGGTATVQSNALTVTTGVPSQDFLSLSVQTHNIEGLSYDGITSNLTVIASDRVGNPVPDGTTVNFITEGSQIVPPSCQTANGTCSVVFKSAQFKPADGRVTVLAYASGEKSFIDLNGNNTYDSEETFYDLGDPFIDASENGLWDATNSREQSLNFAPVSNPVACSVRLGNGSAAALPTNYSNVPSVQNSCSGTWNSGRAYVRRSTVMILSGSTPASSITQLNYAMNGRCNGVFSFSLSDQNGNPMPAGTTIAVGTLNTVRFQSTDALGSVVSGKATISLPLTTVPDSLRPTTIMISVEGGDACKAPSAASGDTWPTGDFTLLIKTPQGVETPIAVHIAP